MTILFAILLVVLIVAFPEVGCFLLVCALFLACLKGLGVL